MNDFYKATNLLRVGQLVPGAGLRVHGGGTFIFLIQLVNVGLQSKATDVPATHDKLTNQHINIEAQAVYFELCPPG